MNAVETLAKLLAESGAEFVFRHRDVQALFAEMRSQLDAAEAKAAQMREALELAAAYVCPASNPEWTHIVCPVCGGSDYQGDEVVVHIGECFYPEIEAALSAPASDWLERKLAEALKSVEEQRDALAAALSEMENAALEFSDGSIRTYDKGQSWVWEDLVRANPSILADRDARMKALGAAEELERLADTTVDGWHPGGELRDMVMAQDHKMPGLDVFSPVHLVISLKTRCAQLRQEAAL